MNILALIPARGGSKSIPHKNIVKLGEHPLIAYAIGVAKLSKLINRVIVSTDDPEIARIAKQYGAEVPFLRPKEISQDNSLDIEFYKHALEFLGKEGYVPDLVVHLRPTTPLREVRLVDAAIKEMMGDKDATALRSAYEFPFTGYKLFRLDGSYMHFFGAEDFPGKEYYNFPRQQLPKTYNPNGYVDVLRPSVLKRTGTLHGAKIRAFITENVADIDSLQDYAFAKKILDEPRFKELREKVRDLAKTT
ncbi:MAG: acylneuraminate cytidylyltransferase family protein [Nanoarchaeota archaeon]